MKTYPTYKESGIEWLGRVPAHWETAPLKYAVDISPEKLSPSKVDDDEVIRYVDIGNVDSLGNVVGDEELRFGDAPSRARLIAKDGDTIVSTVRTYLKAIAYVDNPPPNRVVSTGFAVLRPSERFYPRFLGRLASSQAFVDAIVSNSTGVSYPAISSSRLGDLPVWIPPLPEQRVIADYLDRKTAQIDTLIAKKQRLIDLLKERRTAIINRAVTKGLDPDVPMKDSGIDWLGEVPEHWGTGKLGYVTHLIQTGPFGSQLHAHEYIEGGIPVINPSNLVEGQITPDFKKTVSEETLERLNRHRLSQGDIVFARRGEMGRCALVTENEDGWLCGTGSIKVELDESSMLPEYVSLLLSTSGVGEWLLLESVGSTMNNLNTDILSAIPVPIPPLEEQRLIISRSETSARQADRLLSQETQQVELLKELRTSLISEVVTGKIDVGGRVPEAAVAA